MNFSKISKIMLILIILVVFANIAFASDDALADESVTLVNDSAPAAIAEDASIDEEVLSMESESPLPSDDLESMSDEDVVSASNQPNLHITYRILNDTVYVDDVFRVEVNVTNDGNMNFAEGALRLNQYCNDYYRLLHVDFQSDSWRVDRVSDMYNYNIYVINNKTFSTGDSIVYYLDLKAESPYEGHSFSFYVGYVNNKRVNIDSERIRFSVLPPNVTMIKKSVNGDVFYVGDEIIYNITLFNNHYGQDGRIWKNISVDDKFPKGLKFNDCEFYNSNGELINLDYTFDNYQGLFTVSIPELIDSLTLKLKFKALNEGEIRNIVNLFKTKSNGDDVFLSGNESFVQVVPKINFTKQALSPSVYLGDIVSFKFTVNNTWDRDISNLMISDKLDSYFSFEGFEGDGWVKTGDHTFKYTGTLAPGEVAELIVKIRVDESYPVNLQTVIPVFPPTPVQNPNMWTNTATLVCNGEVVRASDSVQILPSTLRISKNCLNETVMLGDNVTFVVAVTDSMSRSYPYVEITDLPTVGLEFLSCYAVDGDGEKLDVSYVVDEPAIRFTVNDFKSAAFIYTTFKTTMGGWLVNGADLGRPSNTFNFKTAGVYVIAPIIVDKQIYYGPDYDYNGFRPGDNITYEVYVFNPNDYDLTNIVMTELCPENLTFIGFEGENWTRTGEKTFAYNGKLGPENNTFIYLKFKINDDASGVVINNVTVRSDEADNVTAFCGFQIRDDEETEVNDDYEIYLSKYAENRYAHVGDTVRFDIIAQVDGNGVCYNQTIIDLMPNGLEFLRCFVVDDEGNEVSLNYSVNGSKLTITLDEINGSATIYTEFRVLELGYFYNYAYLPENPNNYVQDYIYVSAPLFVSKSLDYTSVIGGTNNPFVVRPVGYVPEVMTDDLIVFDISVNNNQDNPVTGIVLTDLLPEGFKIVSYKGDYWRQTSDNTFEYYGELRAYRNAGLSVTCKVPSNATDQYVNRVTLKSDQNDEVNASCVFKVVPPVLDIEKISLNDTVNVGDDVYFDIIVKNIPKYVQPEPVLRMSGDGYEELVGLPDEYVEGLYHYYIRHNVEVIDTIPEGLEFESCYGLDDFGDVISIDYRIEGNKVIFTIPDLVKSATIKTKFKAIKQGNQVNTAEAPGNPPVSDEVFVKNYNMTVEKITNNLTVYVGEQVSFTIIVKNTGTNDLSEVFVEDTDYTEGIVYDSYLNRTGSGWKYSNGKFVYDGILKAGESASFDVIFNTTKTGKFNNTVVAGSNATDNVTSTNITNVIGDVPEDDPNKNKSTGGSDDDIDDEDDVNNPKKPKDGSEEETTDKEDPNPAGSGSNPDVDAENDASTSNADDESEKSLESSSSISNELATGNPILVLLMVLISIVCVTRYSKK